MTEDITFINLKSRFAKIKEFYSTKNYKYIHVKTIDNFLFHADSFFMKHHKEEICKTLTQYFDIISLKQIDNTAESLNLFNKYVRPLTNLFSELKGFHMAARPWIIIFATLLVSVIFYLLRASIYFNIGLIAFVILLITRQSYFSRQKTTYGFMH